MPARVNTAMPAWALAAAAATVAVLLTEPPLAAAALVSCNLSVTYNNFMYNFKLAAPIADHPHGVLSEDGFYKVSANSTTLWFQLCDQMIFNHDPPRCFSCQGCGGPTRCGMSCSALVAKDVGGYPVCTTIGYASNSTIYLSDSKNPDKGLVVKMSAQGPEYNCSLAVSVLCGADESMASNKLEILGKCDFVTSLRHPSGCAEVISMKGKGLGWFGTLIVVALCLLGAYILVGTAYRFFFLGIRSEEAVPNLKIWLSLPGRAKSLLGSLARRFRSPSQGHRAYYAPINN